MKEVDYKWVYRLFYHPGEVVEIRAKGITGKNPAWKNEYARKNSIIYGYFDNEDSFAEAARALDEAEPIAVWFSANPPKKACLARSPNELEVFDQSSSKTTSGEDVRCIRWFMIDIDPKGEDRVSGTASTKEELDLGYKAGQAVVSWLQSEFAFPKHIAGMSGNGYHIWYRLNDLEKSDELTKPGGLINNALKAIALKWPSDKYKIDIDTGVHKAAQLGKLYGTVARKGKNTEDRPYRQSYLFSNAPKTIDGVPVLDLRKLKKLAGVYEDYLKAQAGPIQAPVPTTTTRMPEDSLGLLDVKAYMEHYGWNVYKVEQKPGGTSYHMELCFFNESHKKDAVVFRADNGTLSFNCFHASCKGYKWPDVRQTVSGGDKLTKFFEKYDPNWKPPAKRKGRKRQPAQVLSEYASDLSRLEVINQMETYDTTLVLAPADINPDSFFRVNPSSGRKEMMQDWAASYVATYLHPIAHTDGVYYKYVDGLWKIFDETKINSILITAMGESVKGNYLGSIKEILAGKIRRAEEDWPVRNDLINVKNGMVDISTDKLELIDHNADYGSRIQLNVNYNYDAECPRWGQFLQEIFPEPNGVGEGKRQLLHDFMAYCLMTTCKFEKCLFCYGLGSNGKSTVIDTLSNIVGLKNTCRVSLEQLSERFQIPALQHKLINLCTESTKKQINTDTLKAAISGEIISGEHKHAARVEFHNTAKFIFGMNEPPGITDRSKGFSRRVLVLEFNQSFEDSPDKDVDLKDYFRDNELDGIFMWMLQAVNRLNRNKGFVLSEHAKKDHSRFMKNLNNVLQFIEERCVLDLKNPEHFIVCSKLHMEFTTWCKDAQYKPWGKHRFYEQIEMIGAKKVRKPISGGHRPHVFSGIDLAPGIDRMGE